MTLRFCIGVLMVSALMGIGAPASRADFGFVPGSVTISTLDPEGQPDYRAGGHPDRLNMGFEFNTIEGEADGNVKEISVELPPGLVGNASAVPFCSRTAFDGSVEEEECPPESKVGVATLKFPSGSEERVSIFNVEPAPGDVAQLGAALILKFPMVMHLRSGDGRVTIDQTDISQSIPIVGTEFELWGVPVDHQGLIGQVRRPFLTMPTNCNAEGLSMTVRARSWQQPDAWQEAHASTTVPLEGCDTLPFDPGIALKLTNPLADTPTGAEVDLTVPESNDANGRASSLVKGVKFTFPEEMSVSPGGAQLLRACSDAGFGVGTESSPVCPPGSKVGTVEIASPLLPTPAVGAVYVGEEQPDERFRMLVTVEMAGSWLKSVGALQPDSESGQLTLALHDLPQVPFSRMAIRFDGGSRALLVTPLACRTATTTATLSSYNSGATVEAVADTAIGTGGGQPCGETVPFAPTFSAGTQVPLAGRATSPSMTLHRLDGEQLPEGFRTVLPMGMVARLGTVQTCDPVRAATGTCPKESRIGSAVAEVGSGTQPAALRGNAYLTGPYKGAPFGLALAFHAALGPFDLGTYVIRGAIRMNSRNGRVIIETDALPRTVSGVLVRFQTIGLDIDRPGFIRNPTSCSPSSFETSVRAVDGRISTTRTSFAVHSCESLPFRPHLSLSIVGRRLQRGDTTGFRIGLRMRAGSTNLRRMTVPLPKPLKFESSGLREICARGDALEADCPSGSRVGTASAQTPLLSEPLKGAIYVAQPPGDGLPDLWTVLEGQGLQMGIRTRTARRHGRVYADMVNVPDIPISNFRMRLAAGDSGVISLRRALCIAGRSREMASIVALEGQDRAYRFIRVPVRHSSCRAPMKMGAKPSSFRPRAAGG